MLYNPVYKPIRGNVRVGFCQKWVWENNFKRSKGFNRIEELVRNLLMLNVTDEQISNARMEDEMLQEDEINEIRENLLSPILFFYFTKETAYVQIGYNYSWSLDLRSLRFLIKNGGYNKRK